MRQLLLLVRGFNKDLLRWRLLPHSKRLLLLLDHKLLLAAVDCCCPACDRSQLLRCELNLAITARAEPDLCLVVTLDNELLAITCDVGLLLLDSG